MKKMQPFVYDILSSQDKLITNIFLLFLLAFGINLLANQIPTFFKIDSLISIIVGIVLILISFFYLLQQIANKRKRHQEYDAFFIYNLKENKLEEIPGYTFSWDQITYMNAAFAENTNLKKFWESEPIKQAFPNRDEKSVFYRNSVKYINELTEYLILRKLSCDLEDYFNKNFEDADLKIHERNDIPEILLKNRFLEIMSHPMSERPLFNFEDDSNSDGKTVYCDGENGAIFDEFKLHLPKNSILRKPKDNVVTIETDKMSISITTEFQGYNTSLPDEFVKSYLKIDNEIETISEFQIQIIIDVNMKIKSLFTNRGWEYYLWIDSFLENLDNYLSEDAFFERINWNTVKTLIHCLNNTDPELLNKKKCHP